jgi:hypothetical protein
MYGGSERNSNHGFVIMFTYCLINTVHFVINEQLPVQHTTNFIKITGNSKLLLELSVKCRLSSVYYKVSEQFFPPPKDLFVVDFLRHPGDLGVSVIVRANCGIGAQLEAFRLFPEYKRLSYDTIPHLLDYAEIDWQSGQCFVMRRKRRLPIPILAADEPTKRRRNTKREGGAQ